MYSNQKKIGLLEIKNRFVRSGTMDGMASEDGEVSPRQIKLYKNLAEGGVGLIITGSTYVHSNGQSQPHQWGIERNDRIDGLSKIAEIIHNHGNDCKVALQLQHCGRQSRALESTLAPSAIMEKLTKKMPREMTIQEIEKTVEAFAQAIRRAKEAGFDAIQLHGAHGYLISEFLSPYTNKRTDKYGGSTENRTRFIKEIYNRSVELVGKDYPILIKMNCDDYLEGGINLDESKRIAKNLVNIGIAAIELSSGMWEVLKRRKKDLGWNPTFLVESRTFIGTKNKPAYHLPYAKEIKKVTNIPLILVGGINSLNLADKILREGSADFISLCRPLIREPDLPKRWLEGSGDPEVECIYCNGCLSSVATTGLRCVKKFPS